MAQNSREPAWEFSEAQGKRKVCYIHDWVSRGADSTERPTFLSNQNLLQTQKEGNGTLRHMNDQGRLTDSLLLTVFLCISPNHLCWKGCHRKKGKDRVTRRSFPFQFFLTHQQAEGRESLQNVWVSGNDIKAVVLILYSFSTVLAKAKDISMH